MAELVPTAPAIVPTLMSGDLRRLSYPSPEFEAWVMDAFDSGRLMIMAQAIVLAGRADSLLGAVEYLGQMWTQEQPTSEAVHVTVSDLERRGGQSRRFARLTQLVAGRTGQSQGPQMLQGLIGHQAIYDLLTGRLEHSDDEFARGEQLPLLEPLEPTLVADRSGQGVLPFVSPDTADLERSSYRQRLRDARSAWMRAVSAAQSTNALSPAVPSRVAARVIQTMSALFPSYARRLAADRRDPTWKWRLLTYLSWGGAVALVCHERRPRILFREVPVIHYRHQVGGGRIDALEVTGINGHVPSRTERRALSALAQERYSSSGDLIRRLQATFRGPLELTIIDWKFLVGDIIQSDRSLTVPDLEHESIPDHQRQIRRYLTLVPFDLYLQNPQGNLWETAGVELRGELWYLWPVRPIRIDRIIMTPEERRAAFTENVALTWPHTVRRARMRQMNDVVVGQLIDLLDGSSSPTTNHRLNGKKNGQTALFPDSPTSAGEIIEAHRRDHRAFVDEHQIIEIIGQDRRGPQYGLHLDAFLAAIHQGRLPVPRAFNPDRGGLVGCLFPDHRDSTPSCHIRLDRGRFFCFGCERGGTILPGSIPDGYGAELAVDLSRFRPSGSAAGRRMVETGDDDHLRVMTAAQQLLTASFAGSSGEKYLSVTRAIEPDLAAEGGAGFGADRLINGLLDLGLTLDELRYYGFIGFSDRISTRSGIVPLLGRRGLKPEHMVRPTAWSTKAKEVLGLPYSVLQSRVTFPLDLYGRVNNIYGRAINPCERAFVHRKLPVDATRVVQGGYRLSLVQTVPPSDEVFITEGVIDALSLIALGHQHVMSMVGVANQSIVTALAQFTGHYAIAFDHDQNQTGQKKTIKLIDSLRQAGFTGQIRDFTADYLAAHPDAAFKDFNDVLVQSRAHAPSP